MGKSFPHPVGVFCTIPNPPKSHIMQKIGFWPYLAIFRIIPIIPIIPLRDNRDAIVKKGAFNLGDMVQPWSLPSELHPC